MSRHPRRSAVAAVSAAMAVTALTACGSDAPSVSTSGSDSAATSPAPASSAPETSAGSSGSSESSSAPSAASSSVSGDRSDLVKFCDDAGVTADKKGCEDHSEKIGSGSATYCSAELPASVKGTVKSEMLYNGTPVYSSDVERSAGIGALYINFSAGKLKLPGGTYTCRFTAGEKTWVGETSVEGPQGRATQGMSCYATSMYTQGQTTHCTSDNDTLSDPPGVGCSALITDLMGRKVDGTLHTPRGSQDVPLSAKFEMGAAVVHLKAPKNAFGSSYPKGDYSCDFKVDGETVISVPFKVS